jgi:PAS domain-containing protein
MNRESNEIANSASEEYTHSAHASAVTLPPQGEALTEHDYRVLFELVPAGIVCQDRAGRILQANPAAQQLLGLSLDLCDDVGSQAEGGDRTGTVA